MTTVSSPYKGLAPFDDSDLDALLFFGRERDVKVIESNLVASRLTVLYGPSGVGKSSVVQAGVVRRLRALPEEPVVMVASRWGGNPSVALAEEVAEAAGVDGGSFVEVVERVQAVRPLYLILDQAEEYFVYRGEGDEFESALAEVILRPLRVNVLIVVREDALARLDAFRGLLPGVFSNLLSLERLDRNEAEAAVVGPLRRYAELTGEDVGIEPALVQRVLDEVEVGRIERGLGGTGTTEGRHEPQGVETPYLQLVLERLWEEERATGSALLRLETLERLGGARQIVGDHLQRALAELPPEQRAVAAAMFTHLVTPSGTKIAHRPADLAAFAGVSEDDLRPVLDRLVARRILRAEERGAYAIYHDVLAAEVLGWRRQYEAGVVLEAERTAAAQRHRRLALLAGVALAVAVVAVGLTVWALVERSNASHQATRAQARELDAVSVSLLQTDPELAVLLAARAARLSPTATAEDVLRGALQADALLGSVALGAQAAILDLASSGRMVVAGTADGRTVVYEVERPGRLVRRNVARGAGPVVAVDALGSSAASVTARGVVTLLHPDRAVRRELGVSATSVALVRQCGVAPRCAVVGAGRSLLVLDAATGKTRGRIALAIGPRAVVAAGPGLVAVRGSGRVVALVDVARGSVRSLPVQSPAESIASDGQQVVVGLHDGQLVVWEASTGRTVARPRGQVSSVLAVAVARGLVVSGASGGAAQIWDTGDGRVVPLPGGHANVVTSADMTRGGTFAVTGSADASAKVWSTKDGRLAADLVGMRDTVSDVAFVAAGGLVVTGTVDGTLALWDARTAPDLVPTTLPAPAPPALEARAPDGTTARAEAADVILTPPGRRAMLLRGHRDDVTSVAFSTDGSRLVTASRDHSPRVWDARTGALELVLKGHFGTVADARFSPDGRWIVTAGPITAGLWNASTGELVAYLRGPESRLVAAAFDGNSAVVTAEEDGTVRRATCRLCARIGGLLELADRRLAATGRVLTPAQHVRYLHEG